MTAGTERSLSAPVTFSQQGPPESWEEEEEEETGPADATCLLRPLHGSRGRRRLWTGPIGRSPIEGPASARTGYVWKFWSRPGAAGRHQAPPSVRLGDERSTLSPASTASRVQNNEE